MDKEDVLINAINSGTKCGIENYDESWGEYSVHVRTCGVCITHLRTERGYVGRCE